MTLAPPPLPFPVVLRVLSLLPRDATLQHALRAAPEWAETVAVGLALEFVQRLRSQTRVASGCGHAFVEPLYTRGLDDINWLRALVMKYFADANRVVPQQLVQDGGLPLRRLIVEAAASRPVIWIVRSSSADEWVQTVLRDVVAGVVATPCCTAITVKDGTGNDGCVTLRFINKSKQGAYFNAAAAAGHLDCMRVIRDAIPAASNDLTARGKKVAEPAVHCAAEHDRPDCLRALLEWGMDPKARDRLEENVAHRAIRGDRVECLRIAHEFGVGLDESNRGGCTPAHLAVAGHPECLRVLRAIGVDVVKDIKYKFTAAHEAARTNSLECLRLLIEWGAYNNAEDEHRRTPAHTAASEGSTECLQLLLSANHITPDHRNSEGHTLMHVAAADGRNATLTWLKSAGSDVNSRDTRGWTPGHIATDPGCLRILLDMGLSIDARDARGYTMAHRAAREGNEACLDLLLSRDTALVEATNDMGDSPAHSAAEGRSPDCLRCLHRHGADLNRANPLGHTPAHRAAQGGSFRCMVTLEALGADIARKDARGQTPAQLAAINKHINFVQEWSDARNEGLH